MPAFSNGNFNDPTSVDDYSSGGGSGDVLSSIISATAQLGTSALLAFGPQNSGLATNPYGQAARYGYGPTTAKTSMTTILLIAVLAFVAFFAYKKL